MAFVRSVPDVADPDLQLHFTPVGYKLTPEALVVLDEPVVTAIPNVNRPLQPRKAQPGKCRFPSRRRGLNRDCSMSPPISTC